MTDLFADPAGFLRRLVLMTPALLIAVTVHELAHALVADRLGDPTARRLGRITLNPLPHIDPLGALCFVLGGFGWAKPVPVNAQNLKHPVSDMTWVAAAGPLANFLAAFGALILLNMLGRVGLLPDLIRAVMAYVFRFNLLLGIFNLIPVPPLDGGHFLGYLLPQSAEGLVRMLERYGIFILLLLVFTGVTQRIVDPVYLWMGRTMIDLVRLLV
jgi:Zn-dependent protease